MLVIDAERVRTLAPMSRLVDCLDAAFRTGCVVPHRQVVAMPGLDEGRLFLSMPAFSYNGGAIVKVVTVCPENSLKGLPTIQGAIIVFSDSGKPMALLDGTTVTHMRTGAASALASRYLSRPDSTHLVVMGTGALAPFMAEAHCAVRPIGKVTVWGRRLERAIETVEAIRSRVGRGVEVAVTNSIEKAVRDADIVSCSTSSAEPVLSGIWLKPGAFVDLVGSFSPSKREADDEVMTRSRIFVDTLEGAMSEAGDILIPMGRGLISRQRVEGEIADLVSGRIKGRVNPDEITLFKSVGTALEDLAASRLILESAAA